MGSAFAVAFGEDSGTFPHFRKFGLNMGSVFINYASNRVEMHKHSMTVGEWLIHCLKDLLVDQTMCWHMFLMKIMNSK